MHEQLDKIHTNIEEHRAEHQANVAERRAERAKAYALDAVDFVYDALAEAEAAVLEAIDLRAIADAKAA